MELNSRVIGREPCKARWRGFADGFHDNKCQQPQGCSFRSDTKVYCFFPLWTSHWNKKNNTLCRTGKLWILSVIRNQIRVQFYIYTKENTAIINCLIICWAWHSMIHALHSMTNVHCYLIVRAYGYFLIDSLFIVFNILNKYFKF